MSFEEKLDDLIELRTCWEWGHPDRYPEVQTDFVKDRAALIAHHERLRKAAEELLRTNPEKETLPMWKALRAALEEGKWQH